MTTVEGVLVIDKPAGLTSHDVVRHLRKIAGIRRIGHTGTLDPLATGLLIICLGRATRLAEYVMGLSKTYKAMVRLGQTTDTFDTEGTIVAEKPVSVNDSQLAAALEQFRGVISQVPPMYSAVKVDGQPLYRYARQGKEIQRNPRPVTIHELKLLSWNTPLVELLINCSSGTYVRVIAHDLGQSLGCGAHLAALRRISIGKFAIEDAIPLSELNEDNLQNYLQPIDTAVQHLPSLIITNDEALKLHLGQRLVIQGTKPADFLVRAYDKAGHFVGLLSAEDGDWQPRKIFYQPDG